MEKKLGESVKVSFDERSFEVQEIIDKPNITLNWTWTTGICPHCKNRITREILHDFYRIEILAVKDKRKEDITIEDIIISGQTLDNRSMVLPRDKYQEVLEKSKNFTHIRT